MLPIDAQPLPNLHASPSEVAMSWPKDTPMFALIGNYGHSQWSRWSIIAGADGERLTLREGDSTEHFWNTLRSKGSSQLLPNWIGFLSYEFGYVIEPNSGTLEEQTWPLADFVWCEKALIHDAKTNSWWSVGGCEVPVIIPESLTTPAWDSLHDKAQENAFAQDVQKTVNYIHEGDIFQANITRRFSAEVDGDIRTNALSMLGNPGGWYGAWLEFPEDGRYVLSMSPELFIQFSEDTGDIVTRPMKGTRPEQDAPEQLLDSEKDAAELHMIVDLMRNDLGRVCEFGSIHVEGARTIERHPTVWQCVGEIHGKVKPEYDVEDVLRATFPPGSVTGAPKIRAMQIIQELENTPRGPYCGAIGLIGKIAMLNVAIRTALFRGNGKPNNFKGELEYSTGCGIVAESDPQAETEESEVKTHILNMEHPSDCNV